MRNEIIELRHSLLPRFDVIIFTKHVNNSPRRQHLFDQHAFLSVKIDQPLFVNAERNEAEREDLTLVIA
jgi:hypothetical protein